MSHKYQGEATGEAGEEHKASGPPRSRQHNGDPPVRRSWRPCQILNQEGELNPHHHHHHHHHLHHPLHQHHHHPPAGRGQPRHRRRPPSGQAQGASQAQCPGPVPEVAPSTESQDTDPRPVQQLRPAVTRYRRHGDPNPRHRGHRQRQQIRAVQDFLSGADERDTPAEVLTQQNSSSDDPPKEQLQDRGSPHQTPVAVVTPTHLSPGPANSDLQQTPPAEPQQDLQEWNVTCEEESQEQEEKAKEQELIEEGGEQHSPTGRPSLSHDGMQTVNDGAEVYDARVAEGQEDVMDDAVDIAARGSEVTDPCSDTESAASLSMDGPLHSPPPLQSPTPPSSPDAAPFPQLDHLSEDASMSPLPDNDLLPEDDEDCSESCSLSLSNSCSEYYPKTYADFYTESHQKSYPEPVHDAYLEPKSLPKSFPEPLKTSYPELHRENCMQSGQRTEPNEAQQESPQEPFTSHRPENVQRGVPASPTKGSHRAPRQGRNRDSHPSPLERSVGCRLHHYDGQSDGEGVSADQSPISKSHRLSTRLPDTLAKNLSSVQVNSGGCRGDEGNLSGEEVMKVSGDAISLAIKDIREAIEEVKTKTVRSPYTPDHPVEPIWVMRQEASPTEESSPHSPSQSASESSGRELVSPLRAESSRSLPSQHHHRQQPQHNHHHHQGNQLQQRDAARPPQTHAQLQPHTRASSNQHQAPRQHQHQQPNQQLPSQQQRPQVQSQSPLRQPSVQEMRRSLPPFPTFVDVPGPCDPDDLIDGIIFAATYLGCTHLLSERTPTKSARMQQAQEAMNRVRAAQKQTKNRKKSPDSEAPSTAEVDLFMSTQRIKVLNADSQECIMDLPLRTISYIADIGNMVVLMARGKMVRSHSAQENLDHTAQQTTMSHDDRRLYRMICHVFESEDAQLIAQSIGQSFSVAYQEFLRANGIDPEDLSQREYSDLLNTQDMYNDDLIHFSKSENCRDVYIEKQKGEILGVVIVESGWGSILPTVIIASLMHAGPAEKSGRLNIGDQIMTINGTSLVGLPLSTCQSIIKGLKSQSRIKMNIVRCPPVTMVLIRRPDLRYQLGFSVQNGIICSLMRGGIAERGGVRVGHRIIEINSQSVVATPHERIVQILSNAMGEIHMKTMPAAMYRLLTAQEQPVYI
ncbi:amyloid-beta A4 precursor protein-binding family A member 1-like [Aulostomus maculatus]